MGDELKAKNVKKVQCLVEDIHLESVAYYNKFAVFSCKTSIIVLWIMIVIAIKDFKSLIAIIQSNLYVCETR